MSVAFKIVSERDLRNAVHSIFLAAGVQSPAADLVADHLVRANLTGHDSHGVGMIPTYIHNIAVGELRPDAMLETVLDHGAILLFEGNQGFGQVLAHDAMAQGIERAQRDGLCLVGLRNSHHIGRIGQYAEQCTAEGLVSLHFVNVVSDPSVAPFGGRSARLGTNPIAIGIPREGEDPIIIDFATSRWAVGKVRVAYNAGRPVPPGTLLDASGEPTTDPSALFAKPGGALLPLGEHKGWCLSLACELLGAALMGGRTQKGPRPSDAVLNSMLTVIISPERLQTESAFRTEMEEAIRWAKTSSEEVRLPGDPERATLATRRAEGIPVDANTWAQIEEAARSVGIADLGVGDHP
jgi:uncharacterized oxidoreductase